MAGQMVAILSRQGRTFDAYLALPAGTAKTAAIVLCSSIHGIDGDHRAIADRFAGKGYIGLAPDLFWRTIPGALARDDPRSRERGEPREERIRTGEADLGDALSYLKTLTAFNGKAATMGFCYGGPYAIIAPKRLGYAAGISCHGSEMGNYAHELEGTTKPIAVFVGDADHASPPEVRATFAEASRKMANLEQHVLHGIKHGYMLRGSASYDQAQHENTMARVLDIMASLKS